MASRRRVSTRTTLESLLERERRLLELRLGFEGEQQSLDAFARELGLSRECARQLERRRSDGSGELEYLVEVTDGDLAESA